MVDPEQFLGMKLLFSDVKLILSRFIGSIQNSKNKVTVKKSTSSLNERGSCSVAGILHNWAKVSIYPLICSLKRLSMWCSKEDRKSL
jgi:hypothetical protein